tara:strand:- start:858 stop:1409 length:552 start_codon:yes stop_codon:yes gene_type:complete
MDLKEIVSIAGRPGLYKIIAQGKNSVFVESLIDKKRFPAHASDKISSLGDISIYTLDDDVKLEEVYEKMFKVLDGKHALSHKEDSQKLRDFIIGFLPNYDSDKVYDSDVKKLFQWYNILHKTGLLVFDKETDDKSTDDASTASKKVKKSTPKPKSSPKPKPKSPKTSASKKSSAVKTGSSRGK